jgi:transposase-like protein
MVYRRHSRHNSHNPAGRKPPRAHHSGVPNPTRERYTPEQIIQVLSATRGKIAAAARQLGCDRETIYDYKKKYPEIDHTLDAERELQLDRTELKLYQAIDKGESWAITLYLKTQGRGRGYVAKVDISADALTLEQLVLLAQQRRAARALANAGA